MDCDEVSVRTEPGHTLSELLAVTVGTAGVELALTVIGVDVPEQDPPPVVTVNVPDVETVMDCVVAPFDHWYDDALLQVNMTLLPGQNAVGPDADTTGAVPVPAFDTTAAADVAFVPEELVTRTVYEPGDETVIALVVCPPGDQRY